MFDPEYPLERVKGAPYNPRRITPESEAMLRESLREIGFVKPIIVTTDGVLVAGHQRTNAARAEARTTAPAFIIPKLELGHEMRFNQIHNGADVEQAIAVRVPVARARFGFVDVPANLIECPWDAPGAPRRHEIFQLVQRYGPWGSCVATAGGEVLTSQQYAIAAKLAGKPLRVFYVPEEQRERVLQYFGREYGEFHYGALPRNPWVQTLAQPSRNRNGKVLAALYDKRVRPELRKGERLLDFGCGRGEALAELVKEGHRALGVEFFARGPVGSSDAIKPALVHRLIDELCADLRQHGLFDVLVLDSVLNSVDSTQAEEDVLTCVNALCRPGGRIYMLGRCADGHLAEDTKTTFAEKGQRRKIEFLDAEGFSAMPRGERWFFQRFHRREEVEAIGRRFVGPDVRITYSIGLESQWTLRGTKAIDVGEKRARASLAREFNLPWPGGQSVGRAEQILEAFDQARRA